MSSLAQSLGMQAPASCAEALPYRLTRVSRHSQVNLPLCREQHIQAFPTVRIYRRGRNALEAGGAPQQGEITSHYEAYNGERSAEAVSEFALHVFAQINANVHTGAHGTDSNNDGVADSKAKPPPGLREPQAHPVLPHR